MPKAIFSEAEKKAINDSEIMLLCGFLEARGITRSTFYRWGIPTMTIRGMSFVHKAALSFQSPHESTAEKKDKETYLAIIESAKELLERTSKAYLDRSQGRVNEISTQS